MNIQIFGTSKSFDTQKAKRYFSERGIRVQYIDLQKKPMSRGEWNSVKSAVGGMNALIDETCKDRDLLSLLGYLTDDAKEEKILENQILIKTPIVRNSRQATVGYLPDIWKTWE